MSGDKIVFLTLLVGSMALTCPSYVCAPMATANDCVEYVATNTTYLVQACAAGSYCPPVIAPATTASVCSVIPPVTVPLSYPGESCTANTNCYSNICTSGFCVGAAAGASCSGTIVGYTQNVNCAAGLYCNIVPAQPVCAALIAAGGACSATMPCTYGYGCYNSVCTMYASIAKGVAVTNAYCTGNASPYCASGQCYYFTANATSMCTDVFVGATSFPISCTDNTACISKTNAIAGGSLAGTCTCSTGSTGKAFCPGFLGDGYGPKTVSIMNSWMMSSSIAMCNIDRTMMTVCMESHWSKSSIAEYMYYNYMYMHQAVMQDIESCVTTVYYAGYAEVKAYYDKYYDSSALLFSAVLAAFAL